MPRQIFVAMNEKTSLESVLKEKLPNTLPQELQNILCVYSLSIDKPKLNFTIECARPGRSLAQVWPK